MAQVEDQIINLKARINIENPDELQMKTQAGMGVNNSETSITNNQAKTQNKRLGNITVQAGGLTTAEGVAEATVSGITNSFREGFPR